MIDVDGVKEAVLATRGFLLVSSQYNWVDGAEEDSVAASYLATKNLPTGPCVLKSIPVWG